MITQTTAIFLDAYRELNAKKLFWIVLLLSAVFMLAFAGFHADDKEITYFGIPFVDFGLPPRTWYKTLFSTIIIGIWLTWAATGLALFSTASIFPDLVSGGSIDLFLSKPISRLRLFITKYFSGLLFVTLQVTLVCSLSFIVLGLRGGGWIPQIFWGIPIVVAVFSYLFSVCVLLGIITRSPLPALTLTILFWLVCSSLSFTEHSFLEVKTGAELDLRRLNLQIDTYDKRIALMQPKKPPSTLPTTSPAPQPAEPSLLTDFKETRRRLEFERPAAERSVERWTFWHNIFYSMKAFLPKTGDTTNLLDRYLISREETEHLVSEQQIKKDKSTSTSTEEINIPKENTALAVDRRLRDRSVSWIVGTSLLFEAVVLSLAAWIFQRRDF